MKYLEQTFSTPAENLAADEALLELAEQDGTETLRIWESAEPFVVLGFSNHINCEVNLRRCELSNIPVLRRFSGGGTVVQGPGCLNYALALRIPVEGPLQTITGTNRFIMEQNRSALEAIGGTSVTVQGHTDLEIGGQKFSGNAQRRGRDALLFHGTILHAADLELFASLLSHPSREPDWRAGRSHHEFITNFAAVRTQIIDALREVWTADAVMVPTSIHESVERLAARHRDPAWIRRRP